MDYEEFLNSLKNDLQNYYSNAGITIENADVQKMQGESYQGLQIKRDGSNVGITMDMHNFFAELEDGIPYHDVMLDVRDAVSEALNRSLLMNVDVGKLSNYEEMKRSLMVQLVSTEKNKEMLSRVPHKEMADMSMIYRFDLGDTGNSNATILVTNQMLQNYGITPDQLHEDAMNYAPMTHPASIRSMESVLFGIPEEESMIPEGVPKLFVATNERSMNGAGVITYPDFMDQVAEKMGGSFYILPSSIHEVLILKESPDVDVNTLVDMVTNINATQVMPADQLTDNVYHFDAEARVFETAHSFEERINSEHASHNQIVEAMEAAGYYLDPIESTPDNLRFVHEGGVMQMESWEAAEEWLNGVVFDDPDVSDKVERILHPEEFKMDVLLVEPGKYPQRVQIGTELEDLQKAVGGPIEVTYPFDDPVGIICNEEGKLNGMDLNRALYDDEGRVSDIIAGPFLVTGLTEDNFQSLTDDQMVMFEDKFHSPETFIRMGRSIMAIPVPDDVVREKAEGMKPREKPAPDIEAR